ncbi:MAG: YjzC family protein [Phycisphaerae bacterium]
MRATSTHRYESNERCPTTGRYAFDGFVDAGPAAVPGENEQSIELAAGETFPKAGRPQRACFWILVEGDEANPAGEAHAPVDI